MVVIVFFLEFSFLTFSHYILYQQSPIPSILSSCSPFSSHSFQTSLNAVLPSHSLSSSSPFPLHFLGICSIFQFFILNSSISTYSSPFFQNFPSLQPPLSIRSFFSYPLSSLPQFFLSSCVRKPTSTNTSRYVLGSYLQVLHFSSCVLDCCLTANCRLTALGQGLRNG